MGGTICGWVTFGTRVIPSDWSWRIPVLLQILLPLAALPGFLMAPESPRWLISVGRVEDATEVLAKHHAGGDRVDPIVTTQLMEIETTINAELQGTEGASYADMIKTKGNRHRLFISITLGFISQWAGKHMMLYSYVPVDPQTNTPGQATASSRTTSPSSSTRLASHPSHTRPLSMRA
jgi:MFS family permease